MPEVESNTMAVEQVNSTTTTTISSSSLSSSSSTTMTTARSNIVDFYLNRSVLITGGSGFIGKVLIEKLLRTCPGIRHIFVLIRPKWDKQPQERLQELLKAQLFDRVRATQLEQKVVVMDGDVTRANLGLSDQNLLRVMNEVSVIFHSAATVKFDEPLKQSVAINITGTKHMIDLCRKIPQLAGLVHVSTAYANCDLNQIDEHVYPVDMDPEKIIDLASWMDQETMQELKLKLLANRPNTYTYTKALAEWFLIKSASDLPVVICRPSIVVASWKEPFSGWIDNFNGPTGIILGAGKGLIRSMYAESSCVADLVPVDSVVNLVVTLGWFAHVYRNHKHSNSDISDESCTSTESSLIGSLDQNSLLSTSDSESNSGSSLDVISTTANENSLTLGKSVQNYQRMMLFQDSNNSRSDSYNDTNNNNNNNNNNNDSNTDYNKVDTSTMLISNSRSSSFNKNNNNNNNHLQFTDDGYGSSTTQSSDTKSTLSSSSFIIPPILTSPIGEGIIINNNNNDSDIVVQANEDARLLSLVAQRRLDEQKSAAFEYKLKQFRHNAQLKLTAKSLPEDIADIPVFHCTSGTQNPITWGRIQVLILSILAIYPSISTYRYPCGSFTNNSRLDQFYRITLHFIPGYIVDLLTQLFGGKPVLVKIFKKFDQAASVLKAFTTKQWDFNTDNRTTLLDELMSDEDKRLFDCDLRPLDWSNFLRDYVLGVRKFILKEPIDNLAQARKNLNIVYYRNLSLQILFMATLAYYVIPSSLMAKLY